MQKQYILTLSEVLKTTGDIISDEKYKVTFDANGGSGTMPSAMEASSGSGITLPDGTGLSKTGFSFGGWNANSSGTGTNYNAGSSYIVTGNVTLYAKWNTGYTVTFNANGGSGTAPAAMAASSGSGITLPDGTGLSRTGYVFGGWNANSSGTGTNYDAGSSYIVTGNATLYAKWNTGYTVTFNANGGTGTVPAAAQFDSAGSVITLPSGDELSRTGYVFGGWNTDLSGTGINYQAGSSYTVNNSVTLFAKWNRVYTVTFNANGGSGTVPAAQTTASGTGITLPGGDDLSKDGYVFGGWNVNASGTGANYAAGSSYAVPGDTTLYAKWIALYTVTFDINGGAGAVPAAQTVMNGTNITLPDGTGLSMDGYAFNGWSTNSYGTGENYSAGSYDVTGNVTLYVRWSALYTVTFDINEGVGMAPAALTLMDGSIITLPDGTGLSMDGYAFGGWNLNSTGTGTNYLENYLYTVTGDITFYAKWKSTVLGDEGNPIQLTENVSANGNISASDGAQWFKFTATAATQSIYVDVGTLSSLYVQLYDSGGNVFGDRTNLNGSTKSTTRSLIVGQVYYIKVTPYSGSGTYQIKFTLPYDGTESYPYPLTAGTWTTGNITSTASGSAVWYSFSVTSGTTYRVWWNDYDGNGTYTFDVRVSATYSNGTAIFTGVDSGYTSAQSFTANQTGTVKLKVYPYSSGSTGTFAIVYSTSSTRP